MLHILTRPEDPTARAVLDAQRQNPELKVEVADLTGARPDYDALVDAIFRAESIAVW